MARARAKQDDFEDVLTSVDQTEQDVRPGLVTLPGGDLAARLTDLERRVSVLEGKPAQAPAPVAVEQAEAKDGLPRWRVSCACPTPLKHQVMELSAADQHQAKMEYCRANGISNSVHPWRIERIADPPAEGGA